MLFIFYYFFVCGVCTYVSADACTCVSTCKNQRMMMSVFLCRSLTLFLRRSLSPNLKLTFRLGCPIAQSPPEFFLSLPPTVGVINTHSQAQLTIYFLWFVMLFISSSWLSSLAFSIFSFPFVYLALMHSTLYF